jgi:hypothetical protein
MYIIYEGEDNHQGNLIYVWSPVNRGENLPGYWHRWWAVSPQGFS